MTREQLDQLWNDPRSWGTWTYRRAEDPRLIVPKRVPWAGWTINFAHPLAWPAIIGSVLLATGPTVLVVALGPHPPHPLSIAIAVGVPMIVIIGGSIWEATRDRT